MWRTPAVILDRRDLCSASSVMLIRVSSFGVNLEPLYQSERWYLLLGPLTLRRNSTSDTRSVVGPMRANLPAAPSLDRLPIVV